MAKYAVSVGPDWITDLEAETSEEAIEKGRQFNPAVDTAEPIVDPMVGV